MVCKKWVQGKPVRRGRIQHLNADFVDGDAVDNEGPDDELGIFGLYATSSKGSKGYHVEVEINGENMDMQIDTAADHSIMSIDTYVKKFKSVPLQKTDIKLKTYTGETLKTCGQIACKVVHAGQEHTLPMIVAENEGKPTLLGRNWLDKLKLDWNEVYSLAGAISANEELDRILEKHADLFREGYDGMKGLEAHIRVRENASSIYFKSCPVPYALKEAVEAELNKLEENGVIVKVEQSDWASPIVVMPKSDGSVRICGDYKVTINQVVDDEQYPLPTAQDLYSTLAGSKVFTKLDLTHAYAQTSVEPYTKLPYGVKSAPKIFQATMDKILAGVEKCVCNQDNILIDGVDKKENLEIMAEVLDRLHKYNV